VLAILAEKRILRKCGDIVPGEIKGEHTYCEIRQDTYPF